MRVTKVLRLSSEMDVRRFCATLLRLKGEAPASLLLTVALTAEQHTVTVVPPGMAPHISSFHHLELELDELESRLAGRPVPLPEAAAPAGARGSNGSRQAPRFTRQPRRARPVIRSAL